ncbi:MAG: hypothetical protein IJ802_06290, partial [Kiritimatiellae bacterium]|nr:hypothetical protein [Kiritimatiellia bacterium]
GPYFLTLGFFPAQEEICSDCDVTVSVPNIKNIQPQTVRTRLVSSSQLSMFGVYSSHPHRDDHHSVREGSGIMAAP